MIVNHSKRFIFIHVPKSAGTSLAAALSQYSSYLDQEVGAGPFSAGQEQYYSKRFGLTKHSTACEVMNVVGPSVWGNYFKFAFVRNPYHRLVSAYHFLAGWKLLPPKFRWIVDQYPTEQSFLESGVWIRDLGPDRIFAPQSYWLTRPTEPEKVVVDFVGKVEAIEEDFNYIQRRINSQGSQSSLGTLNRSQGSRTMIEWTDKISEEVKRCYAKDFELFSYGLAPPNLAS